MSLPRYTEYKSSGVEWLGEVPGYWGVKRLKYNLKLLTEKTERREHPVALENIESWTGRFVETETEFEGEGIAFERGDILFGKLRPYLAKVYLAKTAGEAVGDFHVMRPSDVVDARFAQYQILNRDFIAVVDSSTFGAKMPRASWDSLCNMALATPPKIEQQTIAAFLDCETKKIDALIVEQQRLVELLAEKRQAMISHAVTKGLHPNARMKDSGIEWLGEVPEHWEVIQSRRLFAQRKDKACAADRQLTASQKYGILYQADFMELEGQKVVQVIHGADILKHVEPNDFVISMRSFQGGIEWSELRGSISSAYVMLIPNKNVVPNFYRYLLKSKTYIQALQSTTNLVRDGQALRYENFTLVALPLIPPEEQTAITAYLDSETAKFDTLTAEASRAIELLQERRSALISAAVTGKIDVRSYSSALEAA